MKTQKGWLLLDIPLAETQHRTTSTSGSLSMTLFTFITSAQWIHLGGHKEMATFEGAIEIRHVVYDWDISSALEPLVIYCTTLSPLGFSDVSI